MKTDKIKREPEEILTVTETIDRKHREDLQRLREFRLLDDDFLTKCFEDSTECAELVLQIVLDKPDLKVMDAGLLKKGEIFQRKQGGNSSYFRALYR